LSRVTLWRSVVLASMTLLSLVACDITTAPGRPTPTSTPIPTAPKKSIVFCADETGSYPERTYFRPAVNKMADWIEKLVQPAQDGTLIYIRWINFNSYSDQSQALAPIEIPAIEPYPAALTPLPSPQPFRPDQRATATIGTQQTKTAYDDTRKRVDNGVSQTRLDIHQKVAGLRQLPYRSLGPSDIWGCPQRATELFQAVKGAKYLVIASDMEIVGPQQRVEVHLDGVKVIVIDYKCDSAFECSSKTKYWNTELGKAGAASVTFYSPDQTTAIDQLFS